MLLPGRERLHKPGGAELRDGEHRGEAYTGGDPGGRAAKEIHLKLEI